MRFGATRSQIYDAQKTARARWEATAGGGWVTLMHESGSHESFSYSSSVKWSEAAAMFCSRCSIEEVPGIGNIIGERFKSQASAIWVGLARCVSAMA